MKFATLIAMTVALVSVEAVELHATQKSTMGSRMRKPSLPDNIPPAVLSSMGLAQSKSKTMSKGQALNQALLDAAADEDFDWGALTDGWNKVQDMFKKK